MPAVADQTMAKRRDVTTKMDPQVLADCRIAASFKGMTLAEYLSESMRVVSARDIDDGIRKREEAKTKPQPPTKPEGPKRAR